MGSIKDYAKTYEPPKIKNISDLSEVSVNVEFYDDGKGGQGDKAFTYFYILIDGEEYRVPGSVITQLKDQHSGNPNMTKFKVVRKGTTKEDTKYTVVPLL